MMTPTALYARASTAAQTQSVKQQVVAAEEYASQHGLKIVTRYIDNGVSGTRFETRPAVRQLLHDVERKPPFSILLVYDESRFGRISPREAIYWKYHLERHGVKVRLIHTRANVGDEFASFVLEGLEMGESREYSLKLSRSTFRGQKANALDGFCTGGIAPYAYKRVAIDPSTGRGIRDLPDGVRRRPREEKVILALGDEKEVSTVKRIFQLRLEGYGHRAIASVLTNDGVPCPHRHRANAVSTRWSWMTVKTVLENPVYYGAKAFNRRSQSRLNSSLKSARKNQPSEWILKEGMHAAIVSKSLWQQVNASRKGGQCPPRNKHSLGSSYLLSHLMVCRCGSPFHGITKNVRATGQRRGFYIEASAHNGESKCKSLLMSQDEIETNIINCVASYIGTRSFSLEITRRHRQGLFSRSSLKQLVSLVQSFKSTIKESPPYLQKAILRQFVKQIVIDPRSRRAIILVKRDLSMDRSHRADRSVPVKRITLSLNGGRGVLAKD